MKYSDQLKTYLKNYKENIGTNRIKLKKRILSDPEWVQAFLHAHQDIRTDKNPNSNGTLAI